MFYIRILGKAIYEIKIIKKYSDNILYNIDYIIIVNVFSQGIKYRERIDHMIHIVWIVYRMDRMIHTQWDFR